MIEESKDFNILMEKFQEMSNKDKMLEIMDEYKEIISVLLKFSNDLNIENSILYNKSISEVKEENIDEDRFIDASYVYVSSIKNMISIYLDKIVDILYTDL